MEPEERQEDSTRRSIPILERVTIADIQDTLGTQRLPVKFPESQEDLSNKPKLKAKPSIMEKCKACILKLKSKPLI